jgi:hypothetical protein
MQFCINRPHNIISIIYTTPRVGMGTWHRAACGARAWWDLTLFNGSTAHATRGERRLFPAIERCARGWGRAKKGESEHDNFQNVDGNAVHDATLH